MPDSDTCRLAHLELFLTSDPALYYVEAFATPGNSNHVVVSVSAYFTVTSEKDAPCHCKAFDYSRADWEGFCDHLRDVPWNDIYKYGASRGASEFS